MTGNSVLLPGGLDMDYPRLLGELLTTARMRLAKGQYRSADTFQCPSVDRLVLFGAGSLGRKCLRVLLEQGIRPLAMSDNNPALWGSFINGIEVMPPRDVATRFGDTGHFVVVIWSPGHSFVATKSQLSSIGCATVVPVTRLMWMFPEQLLPHYCFDAPERILHEADDILRCLDLFGDDLSREHYLAQVRLRLESDFVGLLTPSGADQYFPCDLIRLSGSEVFVDGGAYVGDTIADLMLRTGRRFKAVFAFEPDQTNAGALDTYVASLPSIVQRRISIFPAALGSRSSRLKFTSNGSPGSSIDENGTTEIDCVALDELGLEHAPTFIKMDIEGAELEALRGASRTIRACSPKLGICVYHRPSDLWRIPLYIHSVNPNYRFGLRSHGCDGFETVLYATPGR